MKENVKNLNGFSDFEDFYNWFVGQDKKCYYCGIEEHEVQQIVVQGLLTLNRFPPKRKNHARQKQRNVVRSG